MEDEQLKILQCKLNHDRLVSSVDSELVVQCLIQSGIFEDRDNSNINNLVTTELKNITLLDLLCTKRNKPGAYKAFCDALCEAGQENLVTLLNETPTGNFQLRDTMIRSMTASDVKNWLVSKVKFTDGQAQIFEKKKITGKALEQWMSKDIDTQIKYLQIISPDLETGELLEIQSEYDILKKRVPLGENKESPSKDIPLDSGPQTSSQGQTREHDTRVYEKNEPFHCPEDKNLWTPYHEFIDCPGPLTPDCMRKAAESIAACVNSYQNATIHFGIKSSDDQSGIVCGFLLSNDFNLDALKEDILDNFIINQKEVISKSIQDIRIIRVVDPNHRNAEFKVVELDIISSSNNDTVLITSQVDDSTHLFALKKGKPKEVARKDQVAFVQERSVLRTARRAAEHGKVANAPQAYKEDMEKMKQLLTLGNDSVDDGLFPILVTNGQPASSKNKEDTEDYSFIRTVPWKAVFDFDSEEDNRKGVHSVNGKPIAIKPISEFGSTDINKSDRFLNCDMVPWILMNNEKYDPIAWREHHTHPFRKATSMLEHEVPANRAVIVFALLSDDFQVMVDMFKEVKLLYPDRWCVLCDDENVLSAWNKKLVAQDIVRNEEELISRSVSGIPWFLVSEQVKGLVSKPEITVPCNIPSSKGIITLHNKTDYTSLEIVGVDECELKLQEMAKYEDISLKRKEKEREFFTGGKPSWINFASQNHVCKRSIHSKLVKIVEDALEGRPAKCVEGNAIGVINLYHKPGAGASTVGRHVLWDLRKTYRCAVVKDISQVSKHVFELREFGEEQESQMQPVLLLVDEEEDAKIRKLRRELEINAKRIKWEACASAIQEGTVFGIEEMSQNFPVVLLVCRRQTEISQKEDLALRQKLDSVEMKWFSDKQKELEKGEKDNRQSNSKTQMLLSFNLMKENFDRRAIEATVKEYIASTNDKEKCVLKYLSLLSYYDPQFRAVPTAAFDNVMSEKQKKITFGSVVPPVGQRRQMGVWENKSRTSEAWQLLVIKAEERHNNNSGIKICSRTVAEIALEYFLSNETRSQIFMELLTEYRESLVYKPGLQFILRDILCKRVQEEGYSKRSQFSLLIDDTKKHESIDRAVDVLIQGYEVLEEDPFIAQQIARFCMFNDDMERADKYASKALSKQPENSYLHDTRGQVYRQVLVKLSDSGDIKTAQVIQNAFWAIDSFKNAQKYRHNQANNAPMNLAGYYGELDTTTRMLTYLNSRVFKSDVKMMREFLLNPNFIPPVLSSLKNIEEHGEDLISRLKSLAETVKKTIIEVNELFTQIKEEDLDKQQSSQKFKIREEIVKLKVALDSFLGYKNQDKSTIQMFSDTEQLTYRRGIAIHLVGYTFSEMIHYAKKGTDDQGINSANVNGRETSPSSEKATEIARNFKEAFDLMKENLQSSHLTISDDLHILLGTYLVSSRILNQPLEASFPELRKWAKQFYEKRRGKSLEPFLFYVLLNWPPSMKSGRVEDNPPISPTLSEVMQNWKCAFDEKYPRNDQKGIKEGNIFFLAKGGQEEKEIDLTRFIHYTKFQKNHPGRGFWESDIVKKNLYQFEGKFNIANKGSDYISWQYGPRRQEGLKIPSAVATSFRTWHFTPVTFYVCLTWSGPFAYGIRKKHTRPSYTAIPQQQLSETNDVGKVSFERSTSREGTLQPAQRDPSEESQGAVTSQCEETSMGALSAQQDAHEKTPTTTQNETASEQGKKKKKKKKKGSSKKN